MALGSRVSLVGDSGEAAQLLFLVTDFSFMPPFPPTSKMTDRRDEGDWKACTGQKFTPQRLLMQVLH